jgi:hypothetical protein
MVTLALVVSAGSDSARFNVPEVFVCETNPEPTPRFTWKSRELPLCKIPLARTA